MTIPIKKSSIIKIVKNGKFDNIFSDDYVDYIDEVGCIY